MSYLKRRVSLILAIMMLALTIIPLTAVLASTNSQYVSMSVKLSGKELVYGSTYDVLGGEKINVSASSKNADIAFIAYYFYEKGASASERTAAYNNRTKVYSSSTSIAVPTAKAGSTKVLYIEAVDKKDDGSENVVTKTGWQGYYLRYPNAVDQTVGEVEASYMNVNVPNAATVIVEAGKTIQLSSTVTSNLTKIYFIWDSNKSDMRQATTSPYNLIIPTSFKAGETHRLDVMALYDNGKYSAQKTYYLKIRDNGGSVTPTPTPVNGEVSVSHNGKVLANGSTTKVDTTKPLQLSATPASRFVKFFYVWDKNTDDQRQITTNPFNLTIPSTFKAGTTHRLDIMALYDNGEYSTQKTYYITIPSKGDNPTDDGLDVLPWEKENSELETLAVNLRNDSESDKENKNVYAIDEEVTYFVDYRNGGKDIKDAVTLKLELPLTFEVISADNGTVDYNKKTITWSYPNGMESEQEGTKTVIIRYTKFDKKSTDYRIVYPLATIAKANKVVDYSSVINLIYVDSDTTLDLYHETYMYGDKYATTFRPDDTITRAEGALVLTRILLGQNAIDNTKVKSVYPDLDETYLEAQKAIIAATSYGIINGYTDGYYRPNQTMTRAEFMKIIAKYIELNAEDEGIKGLEVKDLDHSIKLYKNPVLRYAVNGTTVSTHWAIEEVSLLVRLNMTSASKNKDLRLDDGISRAEVAQLVNFYTFRAPVKVTSRATTQFSDVTRNHKLFADIVEATRKSHEVRFNEDGTEHVK